MFFSSPEQLHISDFQGLGSRPTNYRLWNQFLKPRRYIMNSTDEGETKFKKTINITSHHRMVPRQSVNRVPSTEVETAYRLYRDEFNHLHNNGIQTPRP